MKAQEIKPIAGINLLFQVEGNDLSPFEWAVKNKKNVQNYLDGNGALLIRGLDSINEDEFGSTLTELFGENLVDYVYRSTPRTELKNKVYTATEYHPSETIPQHNELAFANSWPMRIGFMCVRKAEKRGNTPISDSRIAYRKIPKEIREEFERKKIMYVRNFCEIDLPWKEVFQTSSKQEVEKFCLLNNMEFEWTINGLRTKQVNQASLMHPKTNDKLWFNPKNSL